MCLISCKHVLSLLVLFTTIVAKSTETPTAEQPEGEVVTRPDAGGSKDSRPDAGGSKDSSGSHHRAICKNTADWENNRGYDCNYYALNWCNGNGPLRDTAWTLGFKFNYPERNCCACGAGRYAADQVHDMMAEARLGHRRRFGTDTDGRTYELEVHKALRRRRRRRTFFRSKRGKLSRRRRRRRQGRAQRRRRRRRHGNRKLSGLNFKPMLSTRNGSLEERDMDAPVLI